MGPIIVGVDGSDGSALALRWAVKESAHRGLPVIAAMAWGYRDQHHPADALDAFVTASLDGDDATNVECRDLNDLPAPGLLDMSADADLLVLGARGLGGFKGLLLGSVSQACLHHAKCPVAIVRRIEMHRPNSPERIVVGVDGSPASQAALEWALDEARARRAHLDVGHCWSPSYAMGYSYGASVDLNAYEESARLLLDGAIQNADTHGLVEPIRKILLASSPSAGLLDVAKDADLLIVASRGVGGFRGMVLGSVSYQVTHHADCPVVVVPSDH